MKKITNLKFAKTVIFIFAFGLILTGCFDSPKEFVAPSYNIQLSIPISDSTYTIDDFLNGDTTLTPSNDPNVLGLLFYHQKDNITAFTVSDNLKINDFSSSTSKSIGSVTINNVTPINTEIKSSDWTPFSGGQTVIVPPVPKSSSTQDFTTIDQFESAVFESGTLTLIFTSNLPIENDINSLIIKNKADGSVVVQSSTVIVIPANGSNQVSFPLAGKTVRNSLEIVVEMSSPGSNGNVVTFPQDSKTTITASIGSFTLSATTAILPAQKPFDVTDAVTIDDSTKVEVVHFDSGNFDVNFSNNLDLNININLKINNLKTPDGSIYSQTVILGRKEKNHHITISSLKGWSFVTLTPGQPTNKLSYTATVTVPATSDARTLNKGDNVSVSVNVSNLKIKDITGQIKLTSFDISPTNFNIDLGDVKDKFTFDSLNIKNPAIFLHLTSSVGIPVSFNGIITGANNNEQRSMAVNEELAVSSSEQVFDLRNFGLKDFINGFHNSFPSSFSFSGSGIVNPNYGIGEVTKDDSVTGYIDTELPLDIGIAGGTFRDTMTVDSIKISDSDINAINSVFLTIEVENKIPVKLSAKATVLDKNNLPLFTIPPSYNPTSEILISAAGVDANGFATTAVPTVQTIELKGADAQTFLRNRTIAVNLKLLTPPDGSNTPVKFRNTDQIKVKLYGTADFKLNNN